MSKEQDSATNKSLRVGISGKNAKNALPTLDHFTVTEAKTLSVNDAMERYMKRQNEMYRQLGKLAL